MTQLVLFGLTLLVVAFAGMLIARRIDRRRERSSHDGSVFASCGRRTDRSAEKGE